jgi:hypothetical protein
MPTVRIPLVGSPNNRSSVTTQDQRFVNCFPEVIKNEVTENQRIYLLKRFGTSQFVRPSGGTAEGRGIYYWNSKFWIALGNTLYRTDSDGTNVTAAKTLGNSTGVVGFTEAKMTNDYLIVYDGVKGFYINTTNTVTEITDPQFPTPHLPTPVFMDGYLFAQKTAGGSIYNSDVSDPSAWSGSFITPDNYPDAAVGIARQNNQIAAFGKYSVEFYYNDGTTGTPLAVNSQAVIQFGCASMASVAQQEGLLAFVAQSQTGGKYVVAIDGFEPHNISNAAIERILEAQGDDIVDSWGYFIRIQGHFFYVLNLPETSRTLVYDFGTKMWHEWDFTVDSSSYTFFPMAATTEASDTAAANAGVYFLHQANGWVYKANTSLYQDAGQSLRVTIQTGRFDGDTAMTKFMSRLSYIGDYQSSTSNISVQYTDDDYQNWKPSVARTLATNGRGYLYRLGNFRRRAFKLTHVANTALRAEALEMEIEKGVH